MAIKITQLDPIGTLNKNDLFLVSKNSDGTQASKSCSAKNIADFIGSNSNGGFHEETWTDSLDNMKLSNVGTWWWSQSGTGGGPSDLTSGVVELISASNPNDVADTGTYSMVQKVTFGPDVFMRMYLNGKWAPWGAVTNTNGNVIQYGNSTETTVVFPVAFSGIPSVTVTPTNSTTDQMYIVNIVSVTASQFTVVKFKSPFASSTVDTTTYEYAGETGKDATKITKSEQTITTIGAWEADASIPFNWIATFEPNSTYTSTWRKPNN